MDSKNEAITLSFLLSGTNNCLPSSYLKLRSYLNVHSSNIAGYFGLKLPKSLTSKNTSCPFCYTPWTQNTVSFKLFPSARKRIKESCDQIKTEESIYSRNKLVLKCNLCTKKSSFSLIKKKNSEKKLEQLSTDNSKKKKKRKNKDKHSGLKLYHIEKMKKHDASDTKKGQESLKGSNPSQVTTSGKTARESLKQKKPIKNETNIDNVETRDLKAKKKNMKTNLVINPNAVLNQSKGKKKSGQKLKHLKKAISQEKITAKKTLKDFLTLVNK